MLIDYETILSAALNTQTIIISNANEGRSDSVRATINLGAEASTLEDSFILARDTVRIKRAGAPVGIKPDDLVSIPDEPDYSILEIFDQPRTDSIVLSLQLVDPDDT